MAWTMASQPVALANPNCQGRWYRVMSSDTAVSKAVAVRRRRVSLTTGKLPSVFFIAASDALAIQETVEMGMWPSAMMHYLVPVAWGETTCVLRAETRRSCC